MRLVILILLIALAPLRALAGDVMATRMAVGLTANMAQGAPQANRADGHHCEEAATAAVGGPSAALAAHADTASTPEPHHAGCDSCSLCQMCASAALPVVWPAALPTLGAPMALATHTQRFANASLALAQKPPIF